jgi:hypothetical protein
MARVYYDVDKHTLVLEEGEYQIMVGGSSDESQLIQESVIQ